MLADQKSMNNNRGQSLFEVVFAIAIVGLLITGIVSLSASSLRNTDFSRNQTIATKYANEGVEWARIYRDTDWDNFQALSSDVGINWCLNDLSVPSSNSCGTDRIGNTIFWREIHFIDDLVSDPDGNTVDVEVKVFWDDSVGNHVVNTDTSFTKWEI